jgi:molybdopterin synthase sulfur carrier subunit
MKIQLKLFSMAKEIAGYGDRTMELPSGSHAETVLNMLTDRHPKLSPWRPILRVAVNWEYVDKTYPLQDGDEVAIIPPVSGG